MRILNNKNMKVVVLSINGGGCPRIKVTRSSMQIRDDYNGKVTVSGYLLKRLTA